MRWRSAAWSWPASFRSTGWRWRASCNATGPAKARPRRSAKFSSSTAAPAGPLSPGSCSCSARRRAPAPEPAQDPKEHQMTIGIIGSGAIGTAFARTLARAGIEATMSNSRGPDSLKELARELGPSIKAGTREEAARADIVFIAVNWTKLPTALAGLPNWNGRIVIDANNPIEAPLFKPVDLKGRLSTEVVAGLLPGARVVKAFNQLRADLLAGD